MGIIKFKSLTLSSFNLSRRTSPPPPKDLKVEVDLQNILQLEDRISELPDDIFAIILSQFQLKEIARNSIVSHRWKNLWKLATNLDLDGFKNTETSKVSETNKVKYVEWVNSIIESHEGGNLQDIRIRYPLDKHFGHDIDKWVKFAFPKQVQSFSLHFSDTYWDIYILTRELVENFVNKKFNGFKYLKEITLIGVDISNELVELILNNSPVLEGLCMRGFRSLSTFRVSGLQCALKSLELNGNLNILEISDVTNLVSLNYCGYLPKKLIINNVPSLVDFCFAGSIVDAMFDLKLNDLLAQFSSSLKSLTLDLSFISAFQNYKRLPKMIALEKLVVKTISPHKATSIYACLTELYPSLREFVFQAKSHHPISLPDGKIEVIRGLPHKCIKEVKILGYYGCVRDVEIALYFIKNAMALETLVIDPRGSFICEHPPETKLERDARIRAKKQLKGKVPHRVKLVIL